MTRPRASRSLPLVAAAVATAAAFALGACGGGTGTKATEPVATAPDSLDVFTPGNVFSPTSAVIRVGGRITWRISASSDGTGHNVIFAGSAPGKPADINIVKNVAVSRTFTQAGTFPYACTVHPGMSGDVVVQ